MAAQTLPTEAGVIIITFYYSFIESVVTFFFNSWFHFITLQNRNHLLNTVEVSFDNLLELSPPCVNSRPTGSCRTLLMLCSLSLSGFLQDADSAALAEGIREERHSLSPGLSSS